MSERRTAVVTGAGSGIGAATAHALAGEGFDVVCVGRRQDRIDEVAAAIGGRAVRCDITSEEDVAALAEAAGPQVDVLVNNAGGALDLASVAEADVAVWQQMYDVNVLGTVRVIQALLPALRAADHAQVINIGSTAGRAAYEGGGGYVAAKHGVRVVTETLRLEMLDEPVRFCEIAPGMVATEEFSLVRFGGEPQGPPRLAINRPRGLQPGHRHPERRAGDVVQADGLEEVDRGRVAAVLAAHSQGERRCD